MAKKPGVMEKSMEVNDPKGKTPMSPPSLEHDYSRSGMVNPLYTMAPEDFTGVCRSMVCVNNQGHSNFNIITMYIEKGKIVKTELSDPYVIWEAISRMTHWTELACLNLNSNWAAGKTLSK